MIQINPIVHQSEMMVIVALWEDALLYINQHSKYSLQHPHIYILHISMHLCHSIILPTHHFQHPLPPCGQRAFRTDRKPSSESQSADGTTYEAKQHSETSRASWKKAPLLPRCILVVLNNVQDCTLWTPSYKKITG